MQATADCSDDGCSNDGCSSNCSEDSDYTTATQLHKRGEVGEEYDIFSRVLIEGVSREPIRVFDQIEYCPVEGVSGRDYRQAQVLAVRPASDTRLVLSTGDMLPATHQVRRICIVTESGELVCHKLKGIYRPINEFRLKEEGTATHGGVYMSHATDYGDLIKGKQMEMMRQAKEKGIHIHDDFFRSVKTSSDCSDPGTSNVRLLGLSNEEVNETDEIYEQDMRRLREESAGRKARMAKYQALLERPLSPLASSDDEEPLVHTKKPAAKIDSSTEDDLEFDLDLGLDLDLGHDIEIGSKSAAKDTKKPPEKSDTSDEDDLELDLERKSADEGMKAPEEDDQLNTECKSADEEDLIADDARPSSSGVLRSPPSMTPHPVRLLPSKMPQQNFMSSTRPTLANLQTRGEFPSPSRVHRLEGALRNGSSSSITTGPVSMAAVTATAAGGYGSFLPSRLSFASALSDLRKAHEDGKKWDNGPIRMGCFAESLENDSPRRGGFNLTETIGKGKNCPRVGSRGNSNCAFLLEQYNEDTEQYRSEVIKPLFYNACKESGCKISGEYRNCTIHFACHCGRHHDETRSEKKTIRARERKLQKPNVGVKRKHAITEAEAGKCQKARKKSEDNKLSSSHRQESLSVSPSRLDSELKADPMELSAALSSTQQHKQNSIPSKGKNTSVSTELNRKCVPCVSG